VVLDGDGALAARQDHELGAVGTAQHVGGQCLGRRADGDLLAVQADDLVPASRLLDVVGGDEQDAALVAQLAEQRFDAGRAGGVDAAERLVEQHHRPVLQQRAGDQHALPLAAGEVAEAAAGAVGEADALERGVRGLAVGAGDAPPCRGAGVGAHQHDVERGDGEVERVRSVCGT